MPGRKRAALRERQLGSANVDQQVNTDIVTENLNRDWENGCKWAGIAFAITFGPMIGLGIYWGWPL